MQNLVNFAQNNLGLILITTSILFLAGALASLYVLLFRRQGIKTRKEAFELNSQDVVQNI